MRGFRIRPVRQHRLELPCAPRSRVLTALPPSPYSVQNSRPGFFSAIRTRKARHGDAPLRRSFTITEGACTGNQETRVAQASVLLSKRLLHKWHETARLLGGTKSRSGRAPRLKNQRSLRHINMIDAWRLVAPKWHVLDIHYRVDESACKLQPARSFGSFIPPIVDAKLKFNRPKHVG